MQNYVISQPVRRVRATSYASAGYPTRIATVTKPSGDGVILCGDTGYETVSHIKIVPFGAGADAGTFGMKVLGWMVTAEPGVGTKQLWTPVELVTFAVALTTKVGVDGTPVTSTDRFCDTITSTGGRTFITSGAAPIVDRWFQISPTGDAIGMIMQPTLGFQLLELIFDNQSSATNCNALWSKG
jgi:hypothetical protein